MYLMLLSTWRLAALSGLSMDKMLIMVVMDTLEEEDIINVMEGLMEVVVRVVRVKVAVEVELGRILPLTLCNIIN